MDDINKSCVASYIYGEIASKTSIFLKVSFPSFYPHARPSFPFLEGTTISHQRKLMLLRVRVIFIFYYLLCFCCCFFIFIYLYLF